MIYLFVNKLPQRLLGCDDAVFIIFYGINYIVIGNPALNNIILKLQFSSTPTINHII